MALAYVLDPNVQISNRAGVNNVDGWVEVFLSDTDDHAVTYSNFSGTLNPERIVLDNDGRCVIIADNSVAYRVEMYDRTGNLLWTQYPVWCGMSGGGAVATTIESTDGSINVEKTQVGSTTRYDLSVNDGDDPEFVEWIRCEGAVSPSANVFYPVKQAGTMDAESTGVLLRKDNLYHVSYVMRATKSTALPFYDRVSAVLKMSDGTNVTTVSTFHGIVDFSLGLSQEFGISADVKVGGTDSHLYVELGDATVSGATYELVSMDAHRVYSGVPVLPDGVARRDWVEENFQRTLTAGENVQISAQNVISATDTKYTAGNGLSLSGTEFSADMTVVQHKLTAGDNIVIEGNTISSLGTSYTAGEGIDISSDDTISVDTSVVQTKLTEGTGIDISGSQIGVDTSVIQEKLTPGVGVTIENNVISATAAQQVNSDWNSTSGVSEILNKPDLSVYATKQEVTEGLADKQDTLTAGSNITIENNVISATAEPQVQSDWSQSDSAAVDYIKNKPAQKGLAAGNNITFSTRGSVLTISATAEPQVQADWDQSDSTAVDYIKNKPTLAAVATSGSYNDLLNKPTIPAAQVNSDWNASSGVAQILNKPQNLVQDASYVHTDNNFTTALKDKLDGIASGAEVNVQADWNVTDTSSDAYIANKPQNLVQDASYVHTDNNFTTSLKNKLDGIASGAEVNVQSNWNETNSSSDAYIQNKPQNLVQDASYVHTDNNFTTSLKNKLDGIASGAEVNVQSNWTESDSSSDAYIANKPNLSAVATSGSYNDLTDKPTIPSVPVQDVTVGGTSVVNASGVAEITIPSQVNSDWNSTSGASEILNKPNLATVATTGSYTDLSNTPTIPTLPPMKNLVAGTNVTIAEGTTDITISAASQVNADWNAVSGAAQILNKPTLSAVATSGAYSDLSGTPTVDQTYGASSTNAQSGVAVASAISGKEDSSNKKQSVDATSTTDYPSSKATADFVNSSVATNTARFLGNFTLTDLGLSYGATNSQIATALGSYSWPSGTTPTNNDYVYVEIQNPQTTGIDDEVRRFKYNGTAWLYEYTLNNSSFTAAEKAAIDSGITASDVSAYNAHVADTDIHVTTSDKSTWNAKQDAIADLSDIRSGAALGDTAVQPGDLATVATTGSYTDLSNTPTIPAAQVNSDWNASSGVAQILNKPTLATVATSGSYNDLTDKPTIPTVPVQDVQVNGTSVVSNGVASVTVPAQVQSDWSQSDSAAIDYIKNKPSLSTVATSGSYNDLTDKPSIPAAPVQSNWNESDNTSLAYIQNKPANLVQDASYVHTDNNFTTTLKDKLDGIASGAEVNVQANWTESNSASDSYIQNKPNLATVATTGAYSDLSGTPTIPAAQVNSDWNSTSGVSEILNKPTLATVATSGSYTDLTDKPSIPAAPVQSNWNESDSGSLAYIQNKPSLSTVATSGSYNDLSDKPSIPAAQVQSDWSQSDSAAVDYIKNKPSLATVATSGSYTDLSNTPTIPAAPVQSNWNESDNTSLAYIQNKPSLATVATTGAYSDLSGTPTINNVPAVTSSDDSKVLKASYSGGVGSYSWESESGGTVTDVEVNGTSVVSGGVASITIPTVDQTYNSSSTNAQSGVAVASAVSGKQDTLTAGNGIAITSNVISISITPEALNETTMLQSTPAGISFSIQATKFGRLMLVSGSFDRGGTAATTGQDYLIGTVKTAYKPARVAYTTFGVHNVAVTVQGRVRIDLDGNIYATQNSTSGLGSRAFQLSYILDSST